VFIGTQVARHLAHPARRGHTPIAFEGATTMTVNHLFNLLIAELVEGEVPAPLAQPFTLAAVWADLARLSGEPLPRAVAILGRLAGAALTKTTGGAPRPAPPEEQRPCGSSK
jgi:hypothetical protein